MGTKNILRTMNHRHSKYPEKFNNVKERKKSGPEIAYGRTHSYGSSTFELSRFHCSFFHRVENLLGIGENVATGIFFFSYYVFKSHLYKGSKISGLCNE